MKYEADPSTDARDKWGVKITVVFRPPCITKIFKGLFKGIYKGPKFCTVIGTLGQMWALLALGWVSQDF